MIKETGGQAFPRQQWDYDGQNNVLSYQEEGMTLRDYFAAKAMQSLTPLYWDTVEEYESGKDLIKCLTETAYEYADAMLKARDN